MDKNKPLYGGSNYAVAKALNDHVAALLIMIKIADHLGLPENFEVKDLNRAYVLLTHELEKLYAQSPELSAIEPKPIWIHFEVIDSSTWEINEYFENNDNTALQLHIAKIERLCIKSGYEVPDFSPEQEKLIDYSDTTRRKYGQLLEDQKKNNKARKENDWHIPEYTLTYKPDGTTLINSVFKLKKVHAGSTKEKLLEQSIKNPGVLFIPNLGQTSRNLSTVISSAGFTGALRQLFFPTVRSNKGVIFRPTISREQADDENIDTTDLDIKLKSLGAYVKTGK